MIQIDDRATSITHSAKGIDVEPRWQDMITPYRTPSLWLSLWQLANTLLPLFFSWYLMYLSIGYSYWLTLALSPVTAGLLIRLFIIQHDCGHNSFFNSARATDILGSVLGVLTFTPYYHWRHFHAIHHASTGNLNRRSSKELLPLTIKKYTQNNGDILTLTVSEYRQLSGWERLVYRSYRHPIFLFLVIPPLMFVFLNRLCNPSAGRRERFSVYGTNLGLLGLFLLGGFAIGFGPLVMIQLPVICLSSVIGVWLFYIQHQFEDAYWLPQKQWNFVQAALKGSSYYKLPRLLQWFTGNIGFHHIHHLSPRIPNYYLQKCHDANTLFQQTESINFRAGMKSLNLRLWDEHREKMISFKTFKETAE